jgi:hypothetical protein
MLIQAMAEAAAKLPLVDTRQPDRTAQVSVDQRLPGIAQEN